MEFGCEPRTLPFPGTMPAAHYLTLPLPGLSPVAGKPIIARLDGRSLSSDGGLLVLREVDARLGVAARLAGCIDGPRALIRMARAMVGLYCASFRQVPRRITLDIDDTFDAVHGGQQLRLFNA